jgi:type VI protein secretion system component VasK
MYAGLEPASGTLYKAVERDLSWPGGDGIAFIEGRDEQNGKDRIEVYPGDFAIFRLLERGQIRRISDREWEARWVVNVSGNSVTLPFAILSNTGSHPLQALNSVKTFQLSRDAF